VGRANDHAIPVRKAKVSRDSLQILSTFAGIRSFAVVGAVARGNIESFLEMLENLPYSGTIRLGAN
jgi:hypothetical protein